MSKKVVTLQPNSIRTMNTALITGQDGSFLAEFLLKKGMMFTA